MTIYPERRTAAARKKRKERWNAGRRFAAAAAHCAQPFTRCTIIFPNRCKTFELRFPIIHDRYSIAIANSGVYVSVARFVHAFRKEPPLPVYTLCSSIRRAGVIHRSHAARRPPHTLVQGSHHGGSERSLLHVHRPACQGRRQARRGDGAALPVRQGIQAQARRARSKRADFVDR